MGRPHKECFGCSYCRARGKYEEKEYLTPPSEINPLFNTIPVVINIFYGDPFLYMEDTLECLKRLESSNHKGPVVIITKGPMSDDMFSKIFTKKWKLNIHLGLSFFGNRKYDEAATFERLEENLSVCKSISEMNGYTYGIEYRPIIRDINDSPETMDRLFTLAKKYSTTVAYSGLQVDATLSEYIRENNLPFRPYDGYDFGMKKNIGNDILWNLKCHSMQYNVPIFKKTSCAISYSQKTGRDYNAHYYRPNEMDCASCPNKDVCHSFKNEIDNGNIDYELILKLPFGLKVVHKEHHSCKLHKKGLCKFPSPDCLDINGIMLQTDTELTTSDVRVIKWITGMTVDAVFKESPYISDDWIKKINL